MSYKRSSTEKLLENKLAMLGIIEGEHYEVEHRFHSFRRWRFDFAFIKEKVAIEVQGGIHVNGRHNRGAALEKEYEKLNEAVILGWRVLMVTDSHIKSGNVLSWLVALGVLNDA